MSIEPLPYAPATLSLDEALRRAGRRTVAELAEAAAVAEAHLEAAGWRPLEDGRWSREACGADSLAAALDQLLRERAPR